MPWPRCSRWRGTRRRARRSCSARCCSRSTTAACPISAGPHRRCPTWGFFCIGVGLGKLIYECRRDGRAAALSVRLAVAGSVAIAAALAVNVAPTFRQAVAVGLPRAQELGRCGVDDDQHPARCSTDTDLRAFLRWHWCRAGGLAGNVATAYARTLSSASDPSRRGHRPGLVRVLCRAAMADRFRSHLGGFRLLADSRDLSGLPGW